MQMDRARSLLQSLESGELVTKPGSACYDAFILACVRCQAWEEAASTYRTMKEAGVAPGPSSCHGILVSACKRGGWLEAKSCLEDFAANEAPLEGDGVLLALKTILCLDGNRNVTIESIRLALRAASDSGGYCAAEGLNLIRSLTVADREQQRPAVDGAKLDVQLNRQRAAWKNVIRDILLYVNKAKDKGLYPPCATEGEGEQAQHA